MRFWPRKQVYLDDLPRTHDFRFGVLLVLMVAAVIGAVYMVGYFVAGDRLATGTTVAGVDVGGLDRDEARTALQGELAPRMQQPIAVSGAGQKFVIDPQDAGIVLDLDASVEQGLGSSPWDPAHMLEVVTGGESHDAVVELDQDDFQQAVDEMAGDVERSAVDATVTFAAEPSFDAGLEGLRIDRIALAEALEAAVLAGDESVDLPLIAEEPAVTTTEASDFVDDVATPAVADAVRIRVADTVLTVKPAVFARDLRAVQESGSLELAAKSDALYTRSKQLIASLPHQAVDASIVIRDGRPAVIPGRSGATVAADDWADAVVAAAQERGAHRRAAAEVTEARPEFGTAEARQLAITDRIATVEVRVPGALDDAEIRRAVRLLDGSVIRPGDTFSLMQRLSSPSADDMTAVATGLFESAFEAGLGIVERHEPAIHTVGAAGLDATVGSGQDLAVKNTTPYGVLVSAAISGDSSQVRVQLWGSRYWTVVVTPGSRYDVVRPSVDRQSGAGCRPDPGRTGFSIEVSRALSADEVGVSTETVHSHYRSADRVICRR